MTNIVAGYIIPMKLEDILAMWDKDCIIDRTNLVSESLMIPQLHNKYYRIFIGESIILRRLQAELGQLEFDLGEWYSGQHDKELLEKLNLDYAYQGTRPAPGQLSNFVKRHPRYIDKVLRIGTQAEKVDFLKSIVGGFRDRQFTIKNAIEVMKFESGA